MFRSDFSKYEFVLNLLQRRCMGKFLVGECIFKLFCHCESWRWWQICYACIAENPLNRLLLLLILKRWSVKKGALKNFANFTGNHLCWSLFIIKLQAWGPATFFKREFDTSVLRWNLRIFQEHLFWRAFVNLCMLLYLHRWSSLKCMKKLWWRFVIEIFWEKS